MADKRKTGYLFPEEALPEPVSVQDLRDRLLLLTGYLLGALTLLNEHRTPEARKQDAHAADALRWCIPYLQAMLVLAERHADEFRELSQAAPVAGSGGQ